MTGIECHKILDQNLGKWKVEGGDGVVTRVRGNFRAARWRDRRLTWCTPHRRIWSCYPASCNRKLQCLNGVYGHVRRWTVTELPGELGSRPRNHFSTSKTWPFSTHFLSVRHVATRWSTKMSERFANWLTIRRKKMWQPMARQVGRPIPFVSQRSWWEVKHSCHWPINGRQTRCRRCSSKNKHEAHYISATN
jgi:hypothetical protein